MAALVKGTAYRSLNFGIKVERAAAVLPATGSQNLFAISGGRIIVTGIVGEVTTAASATATLVKFRTVPTTAPAADLNLAAGSAITSAALGTLVSITGTAGDAALIGGATQVLDSRGVVVPIGNLAIVTDATNTGALKYTLLYVPLDDGAAVAAV